MSQFGVNEIGTYLITSQLGVPPCYISCRSTVGLDIYAIPKIGHCSVSNRLERLKKKMKTLINKFTVRDRLLSAWIYLQALGFIILP